jgi:hypothetical protein
MTGITRIVAAALVLLVLSGREASTQAEYTPTLTVTVTGNTVTIEWTPITGALGYTIVAGTAPGQANIAAVTLPAAIGTRVVVSAPVGTYYLRVRAIAGPFAGPFSDEATVRVGLEPCVPGTAPVASATPQSGYVNVSWSHVPGATAYLLQWSRYSGITELVETSTSTSATKFVGVVGTFYVRIVAVTACGNTTSNEVAFTFDLTNVAPRTPNPPPGGRLPIPNHEYIVQQAIAARPDLFNLMRSEGTCHNPAFLNYLVGRLRQVDTRYGFGCRSGSYIGSTGACLTVLGDVVAYNWSDEQDEGTRKLYSFDVIYRHCTPEADAFWSNTQPGPDYIGGTAWTGKRLF